MRREIVTHGVKFWSNNLTKVSHDYPGLRAFILSWFWVKAAFPFSHWVSRFDKKNPEIIHRIHVWSRWFMKNPATQQLKVNQFLRARWPTGHPARPRLSTMCRVPQSRKNRNVASAFNQDRRWATCIQPLRLERIECWDGKLKSRQYEIWEKNKKKN